MWWIKQQHSPQAAGGRAALLQQHEDRARQPYLGEAITGTISLSLCLFVPVLAGAEAVFCIFLFSPPCSHRAWDVLHILPRDFAFITENPFVPSPSCAAAPRAPAGRRGKMLKGQGHPRGASSLPLVSWAPSACIASSLLQSVCFGFVSALLREQGKIPAGCGAGGAVLWHGAASLTLPPCSPVHAEPCTTAAWECFRNLLTKSQLKIIPSR